MELYLDSANFKEIENANELGFIHGLTTTPTFMYENKIHDVDNTIIKLSNMVNMLHIEALGEKHTDIINEVYRLLDLGLDKNKTVFKIPISIEGVKACNILIKNGIKVNIHLVYNIQQVYMALSAGATYICPLVGRLQDQGYESLSLIKNSVKIVKEYNYDTKIMFSSVRNKEHVKNALKLKSHAITIPWKVLSGLTENHLTDIGIEQFNEHMNLIS